MIWEEANKVGKERESKRIADISTRNRFEERGKECDKTMLL